MSIQITIKDTRAVTLNELLRELPDSSEAKKQYNRLIERTKTAETAIWNLVDDMFKKFKDDIYKYYGDDATETEIVSYFINSAKLDYLKKGYG